MKAEFLSAFQSSGPFPTFTSTVIYIVLCCFLRGILGFEELTNLKSAKVVLLTPNIVRKALMAFGAARPIVGHPPLRLEHLRGTREECVQEKMLVHYSKFKCCYCFIVLMQSVGRQLLVQPLHFWVVLHDTSPRLLDHERASPCTAQESQKNGPQLLGMWAGFPLQRWFHP